MGWPSWVTYSGQLYPHKWSSVSCRSSVGQGKFAGQRMTFYHCATHHYNNHHHNCYEIGQKVKLKSDGNSTLLYNVMPLAVHEIFPVLHFIRVCVTGITILKSFEFDQMSKCNVTGQMIHDGALYQPFIVKNKQFSCILSEIN